MKFRLTKYARVIKFLTAIPFITGLLILSELVIPNKETSTKIVSKNESYRVKYDRTTYNIYFENSNDQFNKEVYDNLDKGERVIISMSYFTKEVSMVTSLKTGITYKKDTNEAYLLYGLALVFVLTSLIWLKQRRMSSKEARILTIVILVSTFSLIRILKHL